MYRVKSTIHLPGLSQQISVTAGAWELDLALQAKGHQPSADGTAPMCYGVFSGVNEVIH